MRALPLALAGLLVALPAAAQVGSLPSESPYRDIRHGHGLSFMAATWAGDGGKVGVGPGDGTTFGVRYDLRVSQPMALTVGLHRGDFDRLILDPEEPAETRVPRAGTETINFADLGLQFTLTGAKTWRGFAPFLGAVASVAMGGSGAAGDASGYKFGNKLTFAPVLGTRFFVGDRIFLRLEGRATFWKITYPRTFTLSQTDDPEDAILPGGPESEWVVNPSLHLGLGYSFDW